MSSYYWDTKAFDRTMEQSRRTMDQLGRTMADHHGTMREYYSVLRPSMTTRSPLFSTGNIGPCGYLFSSASDIRNVSCDTKILGETFDNTNFNFNDPGSPFIMDGAPDHQAQSAQRPEYRNDYEAASDQGRMEPSMDITASRDRTSEMFASEGQPTASSDVASTQRDTNMSMDPAKTANSSTPLQAPLTMGRVPAL